MLALLFSRSYTQILDTFKAVNDNAQMMITKSKVNLSKFDLIYYHIMNYSDLTSCISEVSEDRQVSIFS